MRIAVRVAMRVKSMSVKEREKKRKERWNLDSLSTLNCFVRVSFNHIHTLTLYLKRGAPWHTKEKREDREAKWSVGFC
jgi:hypothetical protein